MKFTELSVPKKVLQGNHNTVTFRNYTHFDDCEFINDVKSNDLLNGNYKGVKWISTQFQCKCSYKNRPVESEIQYLDYTTYCKNDIW